MRCHEARKRINNSFLDSKELRADDSLQKHLSNCSACAQLAQASQLLNRDFNSAAAEDKVDNVPLMFLKARVEAQANLNQQKEYSLMAKFAQQLKQKSKLSISLTGVVVALLIFALVPFSINQKIGYEVAFAGVNKDLALNEFKLQEILTKLGIDADATNIEVSGCEATCDVKFSALKSPKDAQLIKAAFEDSENIYITEDVKVMVSVLKGSALDHVKHKLSFTTQDDFLSNDEALTIVIEKLGEDFNCDEFIWVSKGIIDVADGEVIMTVNSTVCGDSTMLDNLMLEHELLDADNINIDVTADGNKIIKKIFIGEGGNCLPGGSMNLDILNGDELDEEAIQKLKDKGCDVQVTEENGMKVIKIICPEEACNTKKDDDEAAEKTVADLPEGYKLSQNYPNPFNPVTRISFTIPTTEHVTLEIININGQKVKTLIDEQRAAGTHSVEWDATNSSGTKVASGVYLYRISAGDFNQVKKATLLK